jgi:hypothetical protein
VAGMDFDGWADLGAQRQAEDEALVQRYAGGEGRGLDMRPVRGFVRHVRRDIGAKGIICDVKMTMNGRGHEIVVWYYHPEDGIAARPQTASVADLQTTRNGRAPSASPAPAGGLASLARSSAAPPPRAPASPAPGTGPGAPGTSTASAAP